MSVCLPISIVCLQPRGKLIFYLSSINLISLGNRTFFLLQFFSKKLAVCQSFVFWKIVFFSYWLLSGTDKWDPLFVYSKRDGGELVYFLYCEIRTHLHSGNEISIFCVMPGTVLNCPLVMCYPWDDNLSYFFVNLYTANNKLNIIIWV